MFCFRLRTPSLAGGVLFFGGAPGRAHPLGSESFLCTGQAVLQARLYIEQGRRWVVNIDLEKFFDRVNHDVLMARVARKVNRAKSAADRPWWNAGAGHMNQACPAKYFESLGLIRLTNHHLKLSMAS